MKIPPNDPRQNVKTQIFWVGEDENKDWYSYACRTPHLPGHIILANKQGYSEEAPSGFEKALNLNIGFLLDWAKINKAEDCYPIFFRMNIKREQFRVHAMPVSKQEIQEASRSLWARIPEIKDEGGFVFYLGQKENMGDRHSAEFNRVAGNQPATEKLMSEYGITKIVDQLQEIVKNKGHRYKFNGFD